MPDELVVLRNEVEALYKEAQKAQRRAREAERHYEKMMRQRYDPIPVMGCAD